jgi:hypothetical protein
MVMTPQDALVALFTEFDVEQMEQFFVDDAKADPDYQGLSENHPKVQRFREVCATLRAEAERRKSADCG